MKRSLIATSGTAGVALLAVACGGNGGYGASRAPQTTPQTTNAPAAAAATPTATTVALANSKLGPILADNQGHSLYLFEADTTSTSTCTTAGCVAEWPPLIATGSPQVGAGLASSKLGTTTRADGRQQVTYSGHPLYLFAGDSQPGSTAGQGLNDNGGLWYVVHTDGTPVDNS